MVRANVPTGSATSQNRIKTTSNVVRSKGMTKNATQKASTATGTRGSTTTSNTPALNTTPTTDKNNMTATSIDSASDKEKLLIDIIPLFDEYQKFCAVNVEMVNEDEGTKIDDDDTDADNNSKLQLRHRLTTKIISLCSMIKITSEMKNLSVIEENDDVSTPPVSTRMTQRLSMITECFVHILNSAVAHLIPPTSTTNGRNNSLFTSTAILELLMSVIVAWMNEQQKQAIGGADCSNCMEMILSLLCQYSECQNDTIRIVSVRALCSLAECIGCNIPSDDTSEEQRLNYLDNIQQAILPRFTDKATAVRCAVVLACFTSSKKHGNPLRTDPDLLQAVQWMVQHDPSPNNRMMAIHHVPINRTTMEYLIPRIRDTKVNVRVAAIHALSKAVDRSVHAQVEDDKTCDESEPSEFLLPSRHIAEIVTAGYTDRCVATKEAIQRMVCTSWIKAAKYNPITLLRWLNVMEHPTVATTILKIWCEVSNLSPQWFQEDLPEGHQQRFINGLKDTLGQFTVSDIISSDSESFTEIIFVARNLLQLTVSDCEKDVLWSQLIPDIPVLCQVLETLSSKLVEIASLQMSLDTPSNAKPEHEDNMIFLCLELLQMASTNSLSMEEGSRRVMAGTIKNLLSNVVTPDDILEECLTTLKNLLRAIDLSETGSVELGILPVLQHLSDIASSSENELFQVHTSIRIVSLITLTLEARDITSQPAAEAMECFLKYVQPAISHKNRLLRQAAVRTMGLLGLLMSTPAEIVHPNVDITSALVEIACNEEEEIEIRIQAMFALTDSVMLQFRICNSLKNSSVFDALCCQIDQLLRVPTQFNVGTTCCAAEIATKLILTFFMDENTPTSEDQVARICTWLARLVIMYFDYDNIDSDDMGDCDEDASQVGHPVRLQQLLSVFFPALTTTSALSQSSSVLIKTITPILTMSSLLQKKKKSSKGVAESLRWVRSIDFVVSNVSKSRMMQFELLQMRLQSVELGESPEAEKTNVEPISEEKVDEKEIESSPDLIASVQVAAFLSDHGSTLSVVIRRALSKWISNQSTCLDIANEQWEDLARFKEILEELVDNEGIDDSSSRRMLAPVLQKLQNVESDIDDADDEEEEEAEDEAVTSLSHATGKINIRPDGNENCNSTTTPAITEKLCSGAVTGPSTGSPSLNRNRRAQRRLRPSN